MADTIHLEQPAIPADKARQGEIILRTRTQRAIFIGGLIGVILLAFLVQFVHLS